MIAAKQTGFIMRQILFLAIAALGIGVYAARYADKAIVETPSQAATAQVSEQQAQTSAGQHRMALSSGRDGHFRANSRVNGRMIDFLVDTGASLVVLRETDAAMIGIRPMRGDYTATVTTANGKAKAAPVKLERVEIGDITVFDVPALIMPDEVVSQNLLCGAFLSKLRRYEVAVGRMILAK
jgi:aspartyl protease family protein